MSLVIDPWVCWSTALHPRRILTQPEQTGGGSPAHLSVCISCSHRSMFAGHPNSVLHNHPWSFHCLRPGCQPQGPGPRIGPNPVHTSCPVFPGDRRPHPAGPFIPSYFRNCPSWDQGGRTWTPMILRPCAKSKCIKGDVSAWGLLCFSSRWIQKLKSSGFCRLLAVPVLIKSGNLKEISTSSL